MMPLEINGEKAQDHFARLPADLFLSILSRIEDLKFLCRCSLVSKSFTSTIYCIKRVSLTLPSNEKHSPESESDISKLFPVILNCASDEIIGLIESSSIREVKFSLFLKKFKELKSISLKFTSPASFSKPQLGKWKAKCRIDGTIVEGLLSVFGDSVSAETEDELMKQETDGDVPFRFSMSHIKPNVFYPFRCCTEWLFFICLLAKCHPSLENISISQFG